ncbi:MAG: T9SS type A sorting domain-containing protein [Bacteroidales bacterium]|nr:T9SS type A sorting domain-containing protein [Bacteroidales bacterium]
MDLTGGKAKFNYTDHYVIEIGQGDGTCWGGTPTTCPTNFRQGNAIRDNWMFHTMRTAIYGRGMGLEIRDNVVRDQESKAHWVHPAGVRIVSNGNTLENRAIDWSGWNVVVDGNDYMVRRHLMKDGPYYSIDGEGILLQECCGGSTVNGLEITNNVGDGGYIGLYKVRDINNALIEGNNLNLAPQMNASIWVLANTNSTDFEINNTRVINNTIEESISYRGDAGSGVGNEIKNNSGTGGTITHSCAANVVVSGNSGLSVSACGYLTYIKGAIIAQGDLQQQPVMVYPNPTYGHVYVRFTDTENASVAIYNAQGKEVYLNTSPEMVTEIDLNNFANGLYHVAINSNGNVKTESLVVY